MEKISKARFCGLYSSELGFHIKYITKNKTRHRQRWKRRRRKRRRRNRRSRKRWKRKKRRMWMRRTGRIREEKEDEEK